MNENKVHKILLIIAILVVAIYSVGMDILNSQQLVRNNELVSDVRLLVYASLDDTDTLYLEDRIMIFYRGYNSREFMENRIDSGAGMDVIWNPRKTISEIDIYDERIRVPKFNIDTDMTDGEPTNDTINNLSEKTK